MLVAERLMHLLLMFHICDASDLPDWCELSSDGRVKVFVGASPNKHINRYLTK